MNAGKNVSQLTTLSLYLRVSFTNPRMLVDSEMYMNDSEYIGEKKG